MSDNTKILVRNAREQDISAVAEIHAEAFSPYGTTETPETLQLRLTAFPNGFIILVADNEIAAYGCSEKWLTERELSLDKNPLATHQPEVEYFVSQQWLSKRNIRGEAMVYLYLISFLRLPTTKVAGKLF